MALPPIEPYRPGERGAWLRVHFGPPGGAAVQCFVWLDPGELPEGTTGSIRRGRSRGSGGLVRYQTLIIRAGILPATKNAPRD